MILSHFVDLLKTLLPYVPAVAVVISAIGLIVVYLQLRQSANTATASLLISINRDLNGFSDVAIWLERGNPDELDAVLEERVLDYISYFEGLYISFQRKLFSIEEVNDYFGGRFLRLANHPEVQSRFLCNKTKYGDIFNPIFRMHAMIKDHRKSKDLRELYAENDLSRADVKLYIEMSK